MADTGTAKAESAAGGLWSASTGLSRSRFLDTVRESRDRIANHPGHPNQKVHGGNRGVRTALAGAKTIGELNAAARAEAKRITGRDIRIDMTGADLGLAKENLEGIMQGLERFPAASLVAVETFGPGAPKSDWAETIAREHPEASGVTQSFGVMEGGRLIVKSTVYFNNMHSADPAGYREGRKQQHEDGYLTTDSPTGTALHEFGHVVAKQTGSRRDAYDSAVEMADAAGAAPNAYIARHISTYAASDMDEFAAEAFADVMVNGASASDVSRAAFDVIETAYNGMTGPSNHLSTLLVRTRERILNHPGHADQSSHGRKKSGVRAALAGAKTDDEVSAAAEADAKRITGRDIQFDFAGSDVELAKEHAEGILRGLERYPGAPLEKVYQGGDRLAESLQLYARTSPDLTTITFTDAAQRGGAQAYRDDLAEFQQSGHGAVGTPMGIAMHEFGHVVAESSHGTKAVQATVDGLAAKAGQSSSDYLSQHVSSYATEGISEAAAEGFADVMHNGYSGAQPASREIAAAVDKAWLASGGSIRQ